MSQENHLGLFDTPPSRRQIRLGLGLVGLLIIAFLLILPVRDVRLAEANAFVPALDAIMFVGELITAALLFGQAAIFRSRAITVLATAYFLGSLLLISHALTFPGAFAPGGLLGAGLNTTGWLAYFRRIAFAVAAIVYVLLKRGEVADWRRSERLAPSVVFSLLIAIVAAASLTLLATRGHDWLPPFYANRSYVIYSNALRLEFGMFVLLVVAMSLLFRARKSLLDMWLLVTFSALLVQSMLVMVLQGRFTAGWYLMYGLLLFSHLVLMLVLVTESSRLYVRLAVSTSGQNREKEGRLMSLNALSAALVQEMGQPLSAAISSATASKNWLTHQPPNRKRAIELLTDAIDAGQQTFERMSSARTKFAEKSADTREFPLDEVVRETTALMDKEFAARNVRLRLNVDEPLRVRGDPIQMRRVLVYLLGNAVESHGKARGEVHQVEVRIDPSNERYAIVDISGGDIEASTEMRQVFEQSITPDDPKSSIELSLCGTIVENQGGYLFASGANGNDVAYRVKLLRVMGTPSVFESIEVEITSLVDDMEREFTRDGCVSGRTANGLRELRLRLEQVLERGGG